MSWPFKEQKDVGNMQKIKKQKSQENIIEEEGKATKRSSPSMDYWAEEGGRGGLHENLQEQVLSKREFQ